MPRQRLRRDLLVTVHQHQQRLLRVVFEDQRLHHFMFIDAQLLRRDAGAAVLFVVVGVQRELHAMLPEELRGRRLAHLVVVRVYFSVPVAS